MNNIPSSPHTAWYVTDIFISSSLQTGDQAVEHHVLKLPKHGRPAAGEAVLARGVPGGRLNRRRRGVVQRSGRDRG